MKQHYLATGISVVMNIAMLPTALQAQPCDPFVTPSGLSSTYTPGVGVLLEWDKVPTSDGWQIKATTPSGANVTRRLIGGGLDQYLIPDAVLSPGVYTWQVQAACSIIPPYSLTLISAVANFTVGSGSSCPATVTDIDGNVYPTVQIGTQCWTSENLKVERYRNGDAIPTGLSDGAWIATTSGASAVYNDVPANKGIYGLLYNWFTIVDPRGLCPTGWHVPTNGEWTQLTDFLGGTTVAGGAMKTTGTLFEGTGLWESPNFAATNSSGFSALPGGFRYYGDGDYYDQGVYGCWWSSSEYSAANAWYLEVVYSDEFATRSSAFKQTGNSVRCLRD